MITLPGDAPEGREQETGECLVMLAFGNLKSGLLPDLVGMETSVDDVYAASGRGQVRGPRLRVVLILDLPDDLLEKVLECDDPGGAAVLVHDHGQVPALPAHLGKQ